jgi:hypothetical protein
MSIIRLKFEEKIILGMISQSERDADTKMDKPGPNKLIVSWFGSSVTAGHDTDFNKSFSEITGWKIASLIFFPIISALFSTDSLLRPALNSLNIELETINIGIGNNPCIPYDLCVETFGGRRPDIIHWEQSYSCKPNAAESHIFESFIRQSIKLESHPIVIFTDSDTPNWTEDECQAIPHDSPPPSLSAHEQSLLEALRYISMKRISSFLTSFTFSFLSHTHISSS